MLRQDLQDKRETVSPTYSGEASRALGSQGITSSRFHRRVPMSRRQ